MEVLYVHTINVVKTNGADQVRGYRAAGLRLYAKSRFSHDAAQIIQCTKMLLLYN